MHRLPARFDLLVDKLESSWFRSEKRAKVADLRPQQRCRIAGARHRDRHKVGPRLMLRDQNRHLHRQGFEQRLIRLLSGSEMWKEAHEEPEAAHRPQSTRPGNDLDPFYVFSRNSENNRPVEALTKDDEVAVSNFVIVAIPV